MTTKVKSSQASKTAARRGRRSSTVKKVESSNINTSVLDDVITSPVGVGLSDGTKVPDGGVLSSPAVGGGVRGGRGRNNSADQTELAINLDAKENEEKEQIKEDSLYNKVVARFSAPAFDKDTFAAELIAKGLPFTEILARVNDGRKEWETLHPAPVCRPDLVLDVIKKEYAKEFTELVGVSPDGVLPSAVRVFSRPAGCLVSRPLASDASASAIVRAVLSWRWKVKDDDEIKKLMAARKMSYYSGLSTAARNGLDLNLSDDVIIQDFTDRLRRARFEMDSDTYQLKKNFMKYRRALDDAISKVVALCPSVALARLGSSDNVFVMPENITKEQKAVCGSEFAKIRNIRRNMTAINAKLWGVSVVL